MLIRILLALVLGASVCLLPAETALGGGSIFVVNSTTDGGDSAPGDGVCDDGTGACTLRAAIEEANLVAGADSIHFNIGAAGSVHTIQPSEIGGGVALPVLTESVIIDGTTQPGYAGSPLIEISGELATGQPGDPSGLIVSASTTTIRGLAINRFSGNGISVAPGSGGASIQANYIGTDLTGFVARANGKGIVIQDSANNVIGGTTAAARNVISGNNAGELPVIQIQGAAATGNVIQGNYIGTTVDGSTELGNSFYGIMLTGAPGNTIGGAAAGAGNLISGNAHNVYISADDNVVQGNLIGTNAFGTVGLGNNFVGVAIVSGDQNTIGGTQTGARNVISGNPMGVWMRAVSTNNVVAGNYIGLDVSGTTAVPYSNTGIYLESASTGNRIGGAEAGARNVISGIDGNGIEIQADSNVVEGNYIGTDAAGTSDLGNTYSGVHIFSSHNNRVGGTTAAARNVISGNAQGVSLLGATGTQIMGNFIGTDASGTADLGNTFDGVGLNPGTLNTTIGGTTPGARNVVSGNGSNGVHMWGVATVCFEYSGNVVQGNYIGTDVTGVNALGNAGSGVAVTGCPRNNAIGGTAAGAGNLVAFNGEDGVRVDGAAVPQPAGRITIRGNSIHANALKGVENINGGNTELIPPVVTTEEPLSGTACAGCVVDVYSDAAEEGRVYYGSATADGAGNWSLGGSVGGPHITATATDAAGNTSEFSAPFDCDFDNDGICDSADPDDDNDKVYDAAENGCGGDPLNTVVRPERVDGPFAGISDDGDAQIDEPLPPGAESHDCDGDGYIGSTEAHVTTSDQDACGGSGWPSDLEPGGFQPNRLNVQDVGSFLTPVRRFGTTSGHPDFDVRWDLLPGGTIGGAINVQDVAATVSGASGFPPMFAGQRAFGRACPWAP